MACRLLGVHTIPAIVVDDSYAEREKVQQFLVENVARLKMRPVDRALLVKRARQEGEETAVIASRFGVSPTTVRRLLAQLDGATTHEVEALRAGDVSLSMHAVIARHAEPFEREAILKILSGLTIRPREVEALFIALGWQALVELDDKRFVQRTALFEWACRALVGLPAGTIKERFRQLALQFPTVLEKHGQSYSVVGQ